MVRLSDGNGGQQWRYSGSLPDCRAAVHPSLHSRPSISSFAHARCAGRAGQWDDSATAGMVGARGTADAERRGSAKMLSGEEIFPSQIVREDIDEEHVG